MVQVKDETRILSFVGTNYLLGCFDTRHATSIMASESSLIMMMPSKLKLTPPCLNEQNDQL